MSDRAASLHPIHLVCFDIDGTIAVGHGWRTVARHRGLQDRFDWAQEEFSAGRATEDVHLARLLNFARGLELSEMEHILATTRHLPHLQEAVDSLHADGKKVALLTHNPGYVCRWYASHYGFDLWAGVEQEVRAGRIQGVRRVHVDKVEGLRLVLGSTGARAIETANLGDGLADALVFPHVATGIALNSRISLVRNAADLVADVEDARRLLPLLRYGLKRPRALPADPPGVRAGSFRLGTISS